MTDAKITRGHSCVSCQQRKVKCDGQRPCSACSKYGKECVSKTGPQASRRRLSATPSSRDSPQAVRRNRINPVTEALSPDGQVVLDGDDRHQRRYVENKLWTGDGIANELHGRSDLLDNTPENSRREPSSSAGNLIFGHRHSAPVGSSHPSAIEAFKLWQAFLKNVHPLVKLLHAPSVQDMVLETVSNLSAISSPNDALLSSIYLAAVTSMHEDECQSSFGQKREALLAKFARATQEALNKASFLRSSNLVVLQAFTLYLLCMRQHYDHQTLWLLTGLASRMGQRLGLHRESSAKGLSPFDAELRRRLWWQIATVDARTSQLCGASMRADAHVVWDTKRPLNVNDSDLTPSMTAAPVEYAGATDMIFCSVRYEIGDWMHQTKEVVFTGENVEEGTDPLASISHLERRLEERYLKHCDPSVPLHILASCLVRSAMCQMRLSAYHPRRWGERDSPMNQDELDVLFENSLKVLEYDNFTHSTTSLRPYLWHVAIYFPFETFILVLRELSVRLAGDTVEGAWKSVDAAFEHHPNLISDTSNALYVAIGNLALKSWAKKIAESAPSPEQSPAEPHCISRLRAQRRQRHADTPMPQSMAAEHSIEGTNLSSLRSEPVISQISDNPGTASQYIPPTSLENFVHQLPHPQESITVSTGSQMTAPMAADYASAEYSAASSIDMVNWDFWQNLLDDWGENYGEGQFGIAMDDPGNLLS